MMPLSAARFIGAPIKGPLYALCVKRASIKWDVGF